MPCDRYRDELTDAAAGGPTAPALVAHIEDCAACRSELAELRRLMGAADDELSVLATAEPSPALRARIREAVAEAGPAPTWRWSFAWPLAAAAVVAVAAFGVWRTVAGRAPAGSAVAQSTPPPAVAESARYVRGPTSQTAGARIEPPATAAGGASVSASARPSRATSVAPLTRRPPSAGPASVRAARRAGPKVLVPAGEQEALLRYLALVHREGLDASVLAAAGQPSPDLAEPRPIEVRPLEIAPLDPAEDSEI